jgi:hypothetical protein
MVTTSSLSPPLSSLVTLFEILLPAILLHGFFDFVLMFIGVVQYIYGIEGIGLEIASLVIALCISIGGAWYAYFSFQKVDPSLLISFAHSSVSP